MSHYRRAVRPGGTFFFTLVTERRAPLFTDANARRLLRESIIHCRQARPFTIDGIVLLPDHLHLLVTLPDGDSNFSSRLSHIKAHFTRHFLASGGAEQPRSAARIRQEHRGIWQRRFWEHTIQDMEDFNRHLDYIHYNPVKHGLACCPHAWPYSSFHRHVRLNHYAGDWCCACLGALPMVPDFTSIAAGAG